MGEKERQRAILNYTHKKGIADIGEVFVFLTNSLEVSSFVAGPQLTLVILLPLPHNLKNLLPYLGNGYEIEKNHHLNGQHRN